MLSHSTPLPSNPTIAIFPSSYNTEQASLPQLSSSLEQEISRLENILKFSGGVISVNTSEAQSLEVFATRYINGEKDPSNLVISDLTFIVRTDDKAGKRTCLEKTDSFDIYTAIADLSTNNNVEVLHGNVQNGRHVKRIYDVLLSMNDFIERSLKRENYFVQFQGHGNHTGEKDLQLDVDTAGQNGALRSNAQIISNEQVMGRKITAVTISQAFDNPIFFDLWEALPKSDFGTLYPDNLNLILDKAADYVQFKEIFDSIKVPVEQFEHTKFTIKETPDSLKAILLRNPELNFFMPDDAYSPVSDLPVRQSFSCHRGLHFESEGNIILYVPVESNGFYIPKELLIGKASETVGIGIYNKLGDQAVELLCRYSESLSSNPVIIGYNYADTALIDHKDIRFKLSQRNIQTVAVVTLHSNGEVRCLEGENRRYPGIENRIKAERFILNQPDVVYSPASEALERAARRFYSQSSGENSQQDLACVPDHIPFPNGVDTKFLKQMSTSDYVNLGHLIEYETGMHMQSLQELGAVFCLTFSRVTEAKNPIDPILALANYYNDSYEEFLRSSKIPPPIFMVRPIDESPLGQIAKELIKGELSYELNHKLCAMFGTTLKTDVVFSDFFLTKFRSRDEVRLLLNLGYYFDKIVSMNPQSNEPFGIASVESCYMCDYTIYTKEVGFTTQLPVSLTHYDSSNNMHYRVTGVGIQVGDKHRSFQQCCNGQEIQKWHEAVRYGITNALHLIASDIKGNPESELSLVTSNSLRRKGVIEDKFDITAKVRDWYFEIIDYHNSTMGFS
jgi:hypothetical protein